MAGNPVSVRIDARARHDSRRAFVQTDAVLEEAVPDHTTFRGRDSRVVFDVALDAPGCRVTEVRWWGDGETPVAGRARSLTPRDSHRPRTFSATERRLLARSICRADSNGDDRGRLGCSRVSYVRAFVVMLADR